MSKKKKATMSIDSILAQISSMKDNSRSFFTKDGDDEIWRKDVEACENAIAILSALQDAGINEPEQIRNFTNFKIFKKKKRIKCVVIGAWVDEKSGEEEILECIGAYKNYNKAYGAALLQLDDISQVEVAISAKGFEYKTPATGTIPWRDVRGDLEHDELGRC